jgi:hypothetical protein
MKMNKIFTVILLSVIIYLFLSLPHILYMTFEIAFKYPDKLLLFIGLLSAIFSNIIVKIIEK